MEMHRVKVAAPCRDPRLLEEGADWVGFFSDLPEDVYDSAFLIPGVLLPHQAWVDSALSALPQHMTDEPL